MGSWIELGRLAEEWERTFGEELPIGFETTPEEIPLIRRCIKENTQKPLDDHIKRLVDTGAVY